MQFQPIKDTQQPLSKTSDRRQKILPEFLLIWQVCNCPSTIKRGITPIFPICRTSWLKGVKAGIYPKPFKIGFGLRQNAWRTEEILALADKLKGAQ